MQVTVRLTIQNRQAQVEVVPTAAALLIRALKEPHRDRKKVHTTNHNNITKPHYNITNNTTTII